MLEFEALRWFQNMEMYMKPKLFKAYISNLSFFRYDMIRLVALILLVEMIKCIRMFVS